MKAISVSLSVCLACAAACTVENVDPVDEGIVEQADDGDMFRASDETTREIGVVAWRVEQVGDGARVLGLDHDDERLFDLVFKVERDESDRPLALFVSNRGPDGGALVLHEDGTTATDTLPENVTMAMRHFELDSEGQLEGTIAFRSWGFSCSASFAYNSAKCGIAVAICLGSGTLACLGSAFACYDAVSDFMEDCADEVDGAPNGGDGGSNDGGGEWGGSNDGGGIGEGEVGDDCSSDAQCKAGLGCDTITGWCMS